MGFLDTLLGEETKPARPTRAQIRAKRMELLAELKHKVSSGNRSIILSSILLAISLLAIVNGESHESSMLGISYTEYSYGVIYGGMGVTIGVIWLICGLRKRSKYKPQAEMIESMDDETFVAYIKKDENASGLSDLLGNTSSIITIVDFVSKL